MMLSFTRINPALVILLLGFTTISASTGTVPKVANQKQVWAGYYLNAGFGKKLFWFTEIENRSFVGPSAQNLFFIRTHLHYKIGKQWDIAPGIGYFITGTQYPEKKALVVVPEYRVFQEGNHTYRKELFTLYNRLRVEERFNQKTVAGQLDNAFIFSMRFRCRLQLDVVLFKSKKPGHLHTLKLRVNDEVMFNIPNKLVKNVYDQNRAYAGINYQPPGPISFEVGYMHLFQERNVGKEYYNRHLVRFSVFHQVIFPVKNK